MKNGGVHLREGDALQGVQMSQWHEMNEQRDGEHNGTVKYRVNGGGGAMRCKLKIMKNRGVQER